MSKLLEIKNISKSYQLPGGGSICVLDDINFEITNQESGKIISILAQLRSGKSTLLKLISSIETPDRGNINLSNNAYSNETGGIIYLPEKPVSFPWLSVKRNIEMASKLTINKKKLLPDEILSLVELTGYENYFPDNRSYGFRFRISLGRALAVDPDIILIDDSFRIMDLITRSEIYDLVKKVTVVTGKTIILATTNITEAVLLSDRILFMKKNPGRIFHDLKLKGNKDDSYVNSVRGEIEELFRKENVPNTLQLTI